VLNQNGEKIGVHEGSELYTIGERHGFTITAKTDHDTPLFVVSKDVTQNTITVTPRATLGEAVSSQGEVKLEKVHWTLGKEVDLNKTYGVRFRYRQEKVESQIIKKDAGYVIQPSKPQDDVANGQTAVIYDGDVCVGAGIVK